MTPQELRVSILEEALSGKITAQYVSDGDAEKIFQEISQIKNDLIKTGKLKKERRLPMPNTRQAGDNVPDNWKIVYLSDVVDVRDGTHDTPKYVSSGIPLATSKNISSGELDFSDVKYITQDDADKINARSMVDDGDILYAMIGSIGNPVIVKKDREFCIKNMALFKNFAPNYIDMKFVYWFLYKAQFDFRKIASGAVQSFVSLKVFREYLFPLPPLAEQKRIVAKIEELMPLVDRYEKAYDRRKELNQEFPKNLRKSLVNFAVTGKMTAEEAIENVEMGNLPIEWRRGSGMRKSDISEEGKNRCVLYGELFTKHKDPAINEEDLSKTDVTGSVLSEPGDILFPATSTASKEDIIIAREIYSENVIIGSDINVARPKKELFAKKYLSYVFDAWTSKNQLIPRVTGTTGIIHISSKDIKTLKFWLPSIKKQHDIVMQLDKLLPLVERLGNDRFQGV